MPELLGKSEQSPPESVGFISWAAMVARINNVAEVTPPVIEIKESKTGVLSRGKLVSARFNDIWLVFESPAQYIPKCNGKGRTEWVNIGYMEMKIKITRGVLQPFLCAHDRVIFSVNGFEYTIYPYKSVDCP